MLKEHEAYLALGSNLGDRLAALQAACASLEAKGKVRIVARSHIYETAPVGGPADQGHYYNAVVRVATTLAPEALLARCLAIEDELGRTRSVPNAPRTLDIDLLMYGEAEVHSAALELPHPRMHQRRFVLAPLAEIAPHARHPSTGRSVADLLRLLPADGADGVVLLPVSF